jgi:hypothetical protein
MGQPIDADAEAGAADGKARKPCPSSLSSSVAVITAAKPRFAAQDSWFTSSTGHQRPERSSGTAWREPLNRKLTTQYGGAQTASQEKLGAAIAYGKGIYAPSDAAQPLRTRSVVDMLAKPGLMKTALPMPAQSDECEAPPHPPRRIFDGLVIYVNGSTYPLVSDHKLKQLLSQNGANLSIHLGRRKVTHVILGRPSGRSQAPGAGGGLASGKLDKEIKKMGGRGIKFVGVEWCV